LIEFYLKRSGLCAIFGVTFKVDEDKFKKALNLMNRGEDEVKILNFENGIFGFKRLAIENISISSQPFYKDKVAVVFNGEIYNYKKLIKKYSLDALSEVEVIYYLWKKFGVDFVKKLEGMFAIAIYDKKLYLFRDEFGKKPLYFSDNIFASEIKPILEFKEKKINYEALSEYLAYNSSIAPNTFYEGIYKLPAGCYYDGEIKRWFDFKRDKKEISVKEAVNEVESLLIKSIEKRKQGEVEIGSLLSGGIDSSLIVALSKVKKTYSIGYEGFENYDERKWARIVAKRFNTNHTEVVLGKNDFFDNFEYVMERMDEPISDSSFFAANFLAKHIPLKVVFSGEGSDELFLGYRRYNEFLGFLKAYLPNKMWLKKYLERHYEDIKEWEVFRRFFANEPVFRGINETFFQRQIDKALKKNSKKVDYERFLKGWGSFDFTYFDLKVWLGEVLLMKLDKMFMAENIEARSPFLDRDLVNFVFSLPEEVRGENKFLIKEVAKEYLPEEIIKRRKKGFAIPFFEWLKEENEFRIIIDVNRKTKIFNEEYLKEILKTGHKRYKQHIWSLYLVSRFLQKEFL
jgi:asparagine synthase (glutamine-hydrolysing)